MNEGGLDIQDRVTKIEIGRRVRRGCSERIAGNSRSQEPTQDYAALFERKADAGMDLLQITRVYRSCCALSRLLAMIAGSAAGLGTAETGSAGSTQQCRYQEQHH